MSFLSPKETASGINLVNKRRYPRTSCECYAQIMPLGSQLGGVNHGLSHDLGEGGVKIRTFRQLPVESRVMVQLGCPEQEESIKVTGSVVWTSQVYAQDQWLMGIRFTDVNDSARARIQNLTSLVSIDPELEDSSPA
ncbi:MAG: PilZ domain-containing protein [Halieaceae bacterium]|nr:PilZ domain-containing protein [Halieaceae bacterium]